MARKRIKLWHLAVGIPVLCGLGGWITVAVAERNARGKIERELGLLRKMGVPTTADGMRRSVPAEQNAAILYRRAMAVYRTGKGRNKLSAKPSQEELATWASGHGETLAFLREAAKRPDCDFGRKWEDALTLSFPDLAEMKEFTRLACAESGRQAALGNFEEAADWLDVGFAIARHVRERTVIAHLVAVANESIVLAELHYQIGRYGPNAGFRAAAGRVLDNMGPLPSMADGMQGEVLFTTSFFDALESGKSDAADWMGDGSRRFDPELMAMRMPLVRLNVEAIVLERKRRLIEKLQPVREDPVAVSKVFSEFDRAEFADQSIYGKLASSLSPIFAQAGEATVRLAANRNVTRAALWVFEERARTGAFPAKLQTSELWAADPFTQSSLKYIPAGSEFKLYSLGANKADDGGVFGYAGTGSKRGDDVAFRGFRK